MPQIAERRGVTAERQLLHHVVDAQRAVQLDDLVRSRWVDHHVPHRELVDRENGNDPQNDRKIAKAEKNIRLGRESFKSMSGNTLPVVAKAIASPRRA